MFWQRPTFIAKFQSLPRQISQFRGHFKNRLEKNEKNRFASNKCDNCTLDIMTDFHWKNEANRWRSEIFKAQITNRVRGVLIRVVSIRSLKFVYGWKRFWESIWVELVENHRLASVYMRFKNSEWGFFEFTVSFFEIGVMFLNSEWDSGIWSEVQEFGVRFLNSEWGFWIRSEIFWIRSNVF